MWNNDKTGSWYMASGLCYVLEVDLFKSHSMLFTYS